MIDPKFPDDEGRRVRYRPSPAATQTIEGKLVRKARAKNPAVMVLFDGTEVPRVQYCNTLEWIDG